MIRRFEKHHEVRNVKHADQEIRTNGQNILLANRTLTASILYIEDMKKNVFGTNSMEQLLFEFLGKTSKSIKGIHHHLWLHADRDEEISNVLISIDSSDDVEGPKALMSPFVKAEIKFGKDLWIVEVND